MRNLDQLSQLTTIGPDDSLLFGGVVAAYAVYRHLMSKTFLQKIATFLRVKYPLKFIHRAFDLIHYVSSAVIGLLALSSRPYGRCVAWADGCRAALLPTQSACVCTIFEKIYYMTFCAYYVVDVMFIPTVPNDVVALTFHHIATISMIVFSVLLRVPVIGVVIMLLHDVVDVPLYFGKVAGYLGFKSVSEAAMLPSASRARGSG